MKSLFSAMGSSWSTDPADTAPPPPPGGPRAPPPPAPAKDEDPYRARDRSPDSVLEDVGYYNSDSSSDAPRASSSPSSSLASLLNHKPKKLRKSVSFHATVSLVRQESLSDLPADEKHRIWYRSDDYSRFVHSELGRRRSMNVTSTSLIMPTSVAHFEVEDEADEDVRMDDRRVGCDSSDYSDSGDDADAPVRVVG
jgi:hypothetical protein